MCLLLLLLLINMGRKLGAVPLFRGEGALGPHLTQCGLSRSLPPYQVAFWSIQPFGHSRHGPKIGGYAPSWWRGASPHLAECSLALGLSPYQVASRSIRPFGHNRLGPKIWGLCFIFWGGELGPHLTQCRLAKANFLPSGVWIHPGIWSH